MPRALAILPCLILAALPALAQEIENLAPYVPSPQVVVDKMLEAAELKAGEVVYDLGCGDGRVVITAAEKFRARGVGIELSPVLVRLAQERVSKMGLQNRITIIRGNLLDVDLRPADVVTLYLLTSSNARLKPTLEKCLKAGARVVSHDFTMRGWKPKRVEKVDANRRVHTIYVYQMPPGKD